MLKKFLIRGLVALFILSFLPLTASANTSAIQPGTLIKGSSQSVYYYGADGKRYVFPNENTYKTWFINFNVVVSIGDQLLGDLPIGGNVTYKPGKRLVKIVSDPKVYYVDVNGTLRHIDSENIAKALYGSTWYKLVDDVPDAFFVNYKLGTPITEPQVTTVASTYSINQDKELSDSTDPVPSDIGKIELEGSISGSSALLHWSASDLQVAQGFKAVMSNEPYPVYPGNDYHYLSDPSAKTDTWNDLSSGTYYFRVCQYVDGKCGVYSNQLILKVGTGATIPISDKKITASKTVSGNTVTIKWSANFTSSQGFKIVKAEHLNPIYPGDDYHYLSEPGATSDTWEGLNAGNYHFRVCEYLGGKCGAYSADLAVTISGTTTTNNSNGTISLSGNVNSDKVYLNWVLSNITSTMGFKVVKAEHSNPIYPGDDYHYYSDAGLRTDTWEGLEAGTYHFRVCQYLGGSCGKYSNDLTLTIQ